MPQEPPPLLPLPGEDEAEGLAEFPGEPFPDEADGLGDDPAHALS